MVLEHGCYECEECGHRVTDVDVGFDQECPKCGASMWHVPMPE